MKWMLFLPALLWTAPAHPRPSLPENRVFSCKHRVGLTQSAYTWAEILTPHGDSFLFQYGIGIESQMTEVYFDSPLEKDSPTEFHHRDSTYELRVHLRNSNSRLSFELITPKKTLSRDFVCAVSSLNPSADSPR